MNIKITKSSDNCFRADCLDLPGSPPIGLGKTEVLALAHLIWLLNFSETGGPNSINWSKFLKREDPIIVNDEKWSLPDSYMR